MDDPGFLERRIIIAEAQEVATAMDLTVINEVYFENN